MYTKRHQLNTDKLHSSFPCEQLRYALKCYANVYVSFTSSNKSGRAHPSLATSLACNLPVDIVGHCHDHQRPTNPSEDHHSTLVQHFGSWYLTKLKPK